MTSALRRWTPEGPYDLARSLRVLPRGGLDPTCRISADTAWRACRTPDGPGTLRVTRTGAALEGEAWGPGAQWLLARMPELLGAQDEPAAFTPRHRLVYEAVRRHPGIRLLRTGRVLESLVPAVLEQKVTTAEAFASYRTLVRRFGEPAPGPAPRSSDGGRPVPLYVPPTPREWALIPSWEWHRANVDSKRAATVVRAARVAPRLEEAAAMDLPAAMHRLQLVPGIGPWTAAETLQRSNGFPDAVTVGDLHLPRIVGWSLARDRGADDARMLELLSPYPGQRHRATRYICLAGAKPPRREPKRPVGNIVGL
ncbi:DNA-3-methyladenine glycosylase family protein [Streptomyces polyrhachis]|uniref:DNA-3-methyladenine glycosylase family protein n=1 Tax=Streptomyces polyrhachis TaxID=1282885 RepID=A0ABW2GJX2_9ACTN